MTRMRAKPRPQAYRHRETAVRAPDLQRKSSNQGRIRAEQHALARFLAANPPNPFLTVPRAISPSQTLWPTVPQRIAQTRIPSQALLRRIAPSRPSYQRLSKPFVPSQLPLPATLRVVAQPTALRIIGPSHAPDQQLPAHRPKTDPLPATFQTIGPTPDPLTNTLPRHRPGAGEPHGATPYCACATPSPSGAPTGQGPLPLCAQHHPSSIRS